MISSNAYLTPPEGLTSIACLVAERPGPPRVELAIFWSHLSSPLPKLFAWSCLFKVASAGCHLMRLPIGAASPKPLRAACTLELASQVDVCDPPSPLEQDVQSPMVQKCIEARVQRRGSKSHHYKVQSSATPEVRHPQNDMASHHAELVENRTNAHVLAFATCAAAAAPFHPVGQLAVYRRMPVPTSLSGFQDALAGLASILL
eukprot:CAMPEP_0172796944 /NCGR_PEP_ID=MMETSP1074-20121228/211238_1 /TAXON_ID=2916 /ORGANISM="Ceratium fusus, Strain PA161109" /LENGTH=202 /DNA_ID=CAMNT_0013634037 /DNA_START=1483 /DNA_END=2094 /DNA_ORIENTATION=-